MKLFDCHNHIQDKRLFSNVAQVMERAHAAGVVRMGVKGCCEDDWLRVITLMESHQGISPAFGLHPWFITDRTADWLETLEEMLNTYPQASVGEIGVDHAVEDRDDKEQEAVFLAQLDLARTLERPVSIHCRRAWGRLIELLDQFGELPRGMLIHCFGGSAEVATELVKRGAYISFSGSITRPNNRRAEAAINAVPEDRLLIETDAPDILPHNMDSSRRGRESAPYHLSTEVGRRVPWPPELNEPANLRLVLAKAAELRGMPEAELADLTFCNAEHFFGGKK